MFLLAVVEMRIIILYGIVMTKCRTPLEKLRIDAGRMQSCNEVEQCWLGL
jgi:hypothetical protein